MKWQKSWSKVIPFCFIRARSLFERKILVKSPEPENNAQRKVKKDPREWVRIIWELSSENFHWELSSENYHWELSSENYHWELSSENYHWESSENYHWESSENYHWELSPSISSRRKVEIYRDTGVFKNIKNWDFAIKAFHFFTYISSYIWYNPIKRTVCYKKNYTLKIRFLEDILSEFPPSFFNWRQIGEKAFLKSFVRENCLIKHFFSFAVPLSLNLFFSTP